MSNHEPDWHGLFRFFPWAAIGASIRVVLTFEGKPLLHLCLTWPVGVIIGCLLGYSIAQQWDTNLTMPMTALCAIVGESLVRGIIAEAELFSKDRVAWIARWRGLVGLKKPDDKDGA